MAEKTRSTADEPSGGLGQHAEMPTTVKFGNNRSTEVPESHDTAQVTGHVEMDVPELDHHRQVSQVYLGSFARPANSSRNSLEVSVKAASARDSAAPSPRASLSHLQLEHLLEGIDVETDSYGLEELRDGFFDASFYTPEHFDRDDMLAKAKASLPDCDPDKIVLTHSRLDIGFAPNSIRQHPKEYIRFLYRHMVDRNGSFRYTQFIKSFLSFFIAYIICLIPTSRDWLGRYNYVIALSAIINHSGRPIGSQIDGFFLTIFGSAAGLAWGSLALYVSTSTPDAKSGYGGILATFLILFTAIIGWLRCVYIRFYQAVICAGFAIFYTCLASTSENVSWRKISDYAIPFVLGQAVCLIIAFGVSPSTGTRPLGVALHDSLQAIQDALPPCNESSAKRQAQDVAKQFVNLSQAVRDFTIELTISPYDPEDIRQLRNRIQAVMRAVLSLKPADHVFKQTGNPPQRPPVDGVEWWQPGTIEGEPSAVVSLVSEYMQAPAEKLARALLNAVQSTNSMLCGKSGIGATFRLHDRHNSLRSTSTLQDALVELMTMTTRYDNSDQALMEHQDMPSDYSDNPAALETFLFLHPLRQTADKVETLLQYALKMQEDKKGMRINLPSYPFLKSLSRSNAQVRHDRGGLTAGFYFRSKALLDKTMEDMTTLTYKPASRHVAHDHQKKSKSRQASQDVGEPGTDRRQLRYQIWLLVHRLQNFESRFALKVTLLIGLISIPAWLPQSCEWWNTSECWWAVVTVWIMMHPRVGGNLQDLFMRVMCAASGGIWAGLAYAAGVAAGRGLPYILALFTVLFMIPMLYRFTQSSHPRSGFIGSISYVVVSLELYTNQGRPSIVEVAWTRGLAFVVGTIAAVIVNWILWPFIARHELRKSLSLMLLHSAVLYRSVVAKYIYYAAGNEPGPEDVVRSEMLEGRLREGFVRIRQLMELTRHEIRIRAPFDITHYSALIDASERFFERLVEVRQSSLYFQPFQPTRQPGMTEKLFGVRRDAVASILMNLYILAGALRANRPVPRYTPSSAEARKRLLDKMDEVEAEQKAKDKAESEAKQRREGKAPKGQRPRARTVEKARDKEVRRWVDVYRFAYSTALTDIVGILQELKFYTKEVTGEFGFGPTEGGDFFTIKGVGHEVKD